LFDEFCKLLEKHDETKLQGFKEIDEIQDMGEHLNAEGKLDDSKLKELLQEVTDKRNKILEKLEEIKEKQQEVSCKLAVATIELSKTKVENATSKEEVE
jgi:hypothetical protein